MQSASLEAKEQILNAITFNNILFKVAITFNNILFKVVNDAAIWKSDVYMGTYI